MDIGTTTSAMSATVDNVERVITGQRTAVELVVVSLFTGQHVLVEGVPGVGKTMLARTIAKSVDGTFKRIQGTSDLLPSDITGASVFDQGTGSFSFVPGPIFAHVVLFDEINRTGPKTQSALLEAMDEGAISADGAVHELPKPSFVVATRNPVEHHGTFPLPEGELDRFGASIEISYPNARAEASVVRSQLIHHPIEDLEPVLSTDEVIAHQAAVRTAHVDESVIPYIVAVVGATRDHPDVSLGASPRASVSLTRAAQGHAVLAGRDYVLPDDVKRAAPSVLAHRILLSSGGTTARARDVVGEVLATVPAPIAGA